MPATDVAQTIPRIAELSTSPFWKNLYSLDNYVQPKYSRVVKHCEIVFEAPAGSSARQTHTHAFQTTSNDPTLAGKGVANIHVIGEWLEVELFFRGVQDGHVRINKFWEGMGEETNLLGLQEGECLPFSATSPLVLQVETRNRVVITYDIVELSAPLGADTYRVMYDRVWFTGKELIRNAETSCNLVFNFPATKLIVSTETPVDSVTFECSVGGETFHLPLQKASETRHVLDFGATPVNFSRLETARLVFDGLSSTETAFHAYTICNFLLQGNAHGYKEVLND